jgi:hypothetical protein
MNPRACIRRSKMTIGDWGRGVILTTGEAVRRIIPCRQFTLDTLPILYPLFSLNRRCILNTGQIDPSVHIEHRIT